jgi:hypothetical protein
MYMCFAETVSLYRSRLCNCSMAGIYKVWCNVEQKFVSGYFDTLPSTCPNNTGHAIDVNSVFLTQAVTSSDAIVPTSPLCHRLHTPVTYKRDLVAEETVLFDIKPGNGISRSERRENGWFRHRRERIESARIQDDR